MTVLGFDNITWGFCILQGVSESVLGILTGVSAVVGIFGARIFPYLRSRLGIEKTGLIGFTLLSSCLAISVASVWSPGSPFSPFNLSPNKNHSHISGYSHDQVRLSVDDGDERMEDNHESLISVSLLLIGIITGRFGLWIADLAVQQIFQENVDENERGL